MNKENLEPVCEHCQDTKAINYGADTETGRESIKCPFCTNVKPEEVSYLSASPR